MTIERNHKDGGFIKLVFDEFFSEMSSADCRDILHLLIVDYNVRVEEVDRMFKTAIEEMKSTNKKVHLLHSYGIFRREYLTNERE